VAEERGEPFLLVMPRGLPYAVQRLGNASPVLCPERALLARIPFGPCPSLHQLGLCGWTEQKIDKRKITATQPTGP
jgi:hypothetical protein